MAADLAPSPEHLLWGIARAFEAAVSEDEADPAARLLLGLGGLLVAADAFEIGDQPEAATAVAKAIAAAAPLMGELSAAGAVVTDAGARGAASLAIAFGQPLDEVHALAAVGLLAEWADITGLAKAQLEFAWRAGRLERRHAAHLGSAAVDTSSPLSGTLRH